MSEYQQVYNQAAFSGVTSFNAISFSMFTAFVPGPSMDTGTYGVSFYLSTQPVGGLSVNLASNEGTFLGTFGTFNLSGPMPSVLTLTGSTITYDPTLGNLLMDVTVNGVSFSGGYNEFFNADYTGIETSRAWNSSIGNFGDSLGGLDTTFGVPEPATWAMMLAGFGMIGGSLRLARRSKVALASAA